MVNSSEFSDTGMFSGQKLPEKTMFMQTCGLLREFLKDSNGSLGLGMTLGSAADSNVGAPESSIIRPASTPTNNFFPTMEKSNGFQSWNMATAAPQNLKPMNFFQDDTPKVSDQLVNKPPTVVEPEKAQMTIFYNGQVIVFNDFPANKAKELMLIASMGSTKNSAFPSIPVKNSNDSAVSVPAANMERIQKAPQQPIDLPIARKASLTRFLEKRKDRINARAPYNTYESFASPLKPIESKSWLGLSSAQSSSNAV